MQVENQNRNLESAPPRLGVVAILLLLSVLLIPSEASARQPFGIELWLRSQHYQRVDAARLAVADYRKAVATDHPQAAVHCDAVQTSLAQLYPWSSAGVMPKWTFVPLEPLPGRRQLSEDALAARDRACAELKDLSRWLWHNSHSGALAVGFCILCIDPDDDYAIGVNSVMICRFEPSKGAIAKRIAWHLFWDLDTISLKLLPY